MKLTDTQLVLLSAAAQHQDGAVEIGPKLKGNAAQKVLGKLLSEHLIEEIPAAGALACTIAILIRQYLSPSSEFHFRVSRTLPISGVSDSNDSIIQSSTDYNLRKRFPSMEVRCSSVDFVSV